MSEIVRATDVFGVSRELPLNYVTRPAVDDLFVKSLTRDKHVIIYGSSKQGKTSLRKQHLHPEEYEVITCSNRWKLEQLHSAILKQAGFVVEQSRTRTESGAAKIMAKASVKASFFGSGGEAGVESAIDRAHENEVTTATLELDPGDVNEVIQALESVGFEKWIVLEDFHYLPEETQRDFAIALKAFHESSAFVFIIVGVWLQENRLIQFNGDLSGRVSTINADAWTHAELREAVGLGEGLLNVQFGEPFIVELLQGSYDSIHVVQESCLSACQLAGVEVRSPASPALIEAEAGPIMRQVVDSQSGRYSEFLVNFANGFGETEYEMYKWLLLPVLMATSESLDRGLSYRRVRQSIDRFHPNAPLNPGNVTRACKSIASLQVKLGIKPLVLDYDASLNRLNVVDRSFLIWLRHQDKKQLMESLGFAPDVAEAWSVDFSGTEEEEE